MRIFLAEGNPDVRLALLFLLDQEQGMEVVGVAIECEGLLAQIEATKPEVVLLDWDLPGQPGRDLVAALRASGARPEVVVCGVRSEVEKAAMEAGAIAFVGKDAPPDKLLPILRRIAAKHVGAEASA